MITTADQITLDASGSFESGYAREYKGPNIHCIVREGDIRSNRWLVEVICVDSSDNYLGGRVFEYTTTELNAYTPTGADDVEKFFNLVEQAVVDSLEALNPSATIEIA